MGMDPVTLGAIIMAGGAVASRVTAPQGQQLSSFEGANSELDPHHTLAEAKHAIEQTFSAVAQHASQPVDMSDAYVQNLPSFTGGAMPMPVGVTGSWGGGKPAGTVPASEQFPLTQFPGTFSSSPNDTRTGVPNAGGSDGTGRTNPNAPATSPTPPIGTAVPRGTASVGSTGLDGGDGTGGGSSTSPADASAFKGFAGSLLSDLDGDNTAPVRKLAVMPNSPDASPNAMNASSLTDANANSTDPTRAIGAVSLLLHLAKPGQNGAQGLGF